MKYKMKLITSSSLFILHHRYL